MRRAPASRRFVLAGAAAAAAVAVAVSLAVIDSGGQGAQFSAALAPTGLVPDARGPGDADQDVVRMADRAGGHGASTPRRRTFYEAWLKNGAGVLVPVGTFNDGRSVTLWAGVSPEEFRTLTVTRERADGRQASSGEKVLVGTATERPQG